MPRMPAELLLQYLGTCCAGSLSDMDQTRSDGQDLAGHSKPCNWRWLLVDCLAANAPSAESSGG